MRIAGTRDASALMTAVTLSVGLLVGAASVPQPANAYPRMIFSQPPNDTPEQAQPFRGEARLVGEVKGGERDVFRWALDDSETDRLWHLELQGIGEGGVAAELFWPGESDAPAAVATFGAASEAAAEDVSLLTLSVAPSRNRARREPLIVPPGEHLIRLQPEAGEGQYQLTLTSGERINIRGTAGPDRADTMAVAPGRQWFFQLIVPESVIPLVPEGSARQLWRVELLGELGAPLEAWLTDADGVELERPVEASPLAHQWGRLELPEGSQLHLRHVDEENIGRVGVRLAEDGMRPEPVAEAPQAAEVEAVATAEEEALWLVFGETLTLDLVPRQGHYLAFSLDEQEVGQRLDVVGDTDHDIEVCLDRRDGGDRVCRNGPGEGLFDAMRLPAGDYLLRLQLSRRADAPVATEVRLVEAALPDHEGWVAVPNDAPGWAAVLNPEEPRQRLFQASQASQVGWFELNVGGDPQAWEIRAEGQPIDRLALYIAGERRPFLDSERSRRGDPLDLRSLSPVWLLPGRYLVRVEGQDSDYSLEARPLGQPGPGREVEPNDRPEDANPLWLGEVIEGYFHGENDVDNFHFHLPGENLVALEVTPPEGLELRAELYWQGSRRLRVPVAEPTTLVERLPPGDYTLALSGSRVSSAPYRIGVAIVEPSFDSIPLVPEDGIIDKHLGDGGLLRLPVTEVARELQIEGRFSELGGGRTGLAFRTRGGEPLEIREGEGRHQSVVTLPANTEVLLETSFGRAARAVTLTDPAYPLPDEAASPPVAASLESEVAALAPFADVGQRVPVRLKINNTEAEPLSLPLEAHLSHAGSVLVGLPEAVELAPGESRVLSLTLELPPALMERPAVSLFVRAGEAGSARLDLPLAIGSEPVDPLPVPAVPEPLDGQVDLAWSALGAHFVEGATGADMRYSHFLIDGMAGAASSIEVSGDPGVALAPIRLAGEGGWVHGLAFNQRSRHEHDYRWREVEIALGETLDTLETQLTVELDSRDGEQFFSLEAPVAARYVQLRPLSLHLGEHERRNSRHGTGELRVLGEPRGELAERRHDLLDRELGGHWIYTLPDSDRLHGFQGQRYTQAEITGERRAQRGQRIRGERIEMVFAFLQHRAARLDALHWVDNLDWDGLPVEEVAVHTSLESPVGPWEHQADWALDRDEEGRAILALTEAPRARYLRLVFDEPAVPEGERRASWRIPEALQAFEADTLGSGRSILGHWGLDTPRGPLEAEQGELVRSRGVEDPDSQADSPWSLDDSVVGRVMEPGDSRHYTLSLAAPDNTLAFEFEEPARDRLRVSLVGPQGEPVPLEWSWLAGGRRQADAVDIPPGEYRLTVTEPPRSIVFLWDGSGSVASHQPAIYQALNRFAEGLEPGKEVFNMIPLGGPLLIDGWAEQPLQVAQTLATYDGRFSSSNSETSLALASRALERRDGQRAIFLITDAEQTGRDIEAWETLARVRPRIFTLEATHGSRKETEENRWYQNQMLSWAQVADGRYRYTVDRTSLIRGFEAGMRELRRPNEFLLAVERRYQEPPEPGSLAVVEADPEQPAVAAGVVHLIFDASGSMLRRMDGGRRIEVARTIVQQVLDERVPESVPVALRAYGHTEPHSCETELLVAPHDGSHAEVSEVVAGIQAINLARTPLAASIEAVLDDLSEYSDRQRLVVMLTDGEETCDGDVAAAVDELIEEGVDVRLNIVGFHIDEIGLQAEFERFAARGGGEYFDSHDGDELIEGLANALAATWRVLDGTGEEVARGRVGDAAVELEVGEYELVVETQAGEQRQAFRVGPRQSVEIAIGSERE